MSTEYARVGELLITQFCGPGNPSTGKARLKLQLTPTTGLNYARLGVAEVRELRDQLGRWLRESRTLREVVTAGAESSHPVHAVDGASITLCGKEIYGDGRRRYHPAINWCAECTHHPRFQRAIWAWKESEKQP